MNLGSNHFVLLLLLVSCGRMEADEINSNRDIRPLLSNNGFQRHGPNADQREADLRLDIEASAKEAIIVP